MTSKAEARALRRLGGFFFGQAQVEGSAIGCVSVLVDSDSLTDAERRFLLERMVPDELAHARLLGAWAGRLGRPPAPRIDSKAPSCLQEPRRGSKGLLTPLSTPGASGRPHDALASQYLRDIGTAPHLGGDLRLAHALMVIRVGEDQVLRSFPLWSKRLQEWQPELAQDLGALLADERDHARVSRDIAERWARDIPTLARIHAPRYTEARRVYTVLAGAVTAPIWREIEACLT